MSSAICFNLDQSKILSSGHGLKGKALLVSPALNVLGDKLNMVYIITFISERIERIFVFFGERSKFISSSEHHE